MPFVSSPPFPFIVISPSGGDDYPAAQAAINAAMDQGKQVIIAGYLRLSQTLVVSSTAYGKSIKIEGRQQSSCGFAPYNAAADGITLLRFDTSRGHAPFFSTVENLSFNSRSLAINSFTDAKTSGYGLEIKDVLGFEGRNLHFNGQYDAVGITGTAPADVNGSQSVTLRQLNIYSTIRRGLHVAGSAAVWIDTVQMYQPGLSNPGSISVGVLHESRDDVHYKNVECLKFDTGFKVKFANTSAGINGVLTLTAVYCDTGYGDGFVFDGTGDNFDEVMLNECWAGYNVGNGVVLLGSALTGVKWRGGIVQANAMNGFKFTSGAAEGRHEISGCQIIGNSDDGINIASGIGGINIHDNVITDGVGYGLQFGTQTYGINLGGSHAGLRIINNDIRGNVTGAINGSYAGSSNRVWGNLGVNPKGSLTAPSVPSTTVAHTNTFGHDCTVYVTGGTVTAIAVGGTATGATSGPIRVAAGQTITLTYSSAPTWTWFGD